MCGFVASICMIVAAQFDYSVATAEQYCYLAYDMISYIFYYLYLYLVKSMNNPLVAKWLSTNHYS